MSFRAALDEHLRAISERDMTALKATIHPTELVLITAQGELFTEPAKFVELHAGWFDIPGWSLGTQLVHSAEVGDLATAVLLLDYHDRDPAGNAIHEKSYLTLIFRRINGRWLLVHDQNTPIKSPA